MDALSGKFAIQATVVTTASCMHYCITIYIHRVSKKLCQLIFCSMSVNRFL